MPDWTIKVESIFKVVTYVAILSFGLSAFWVSGLRLSAEIDALILFLIAYTLLLILPFSKFKLSASGFEGELDRLKREKESSPVSAEADKVVTQEVAQFTENYAEPDIVLMKLAIEIETTLRAIAEQSGQSRTKTSMGMLARMLEQKEIITDKWLIEALHFFQKHRNEVMHEGKTTDVQDAIEVGRRVLANLRDIQQSGKKA